MPGINSYNAFGGIPAASFKSQQDLAGELGNSQQVISSMKSGQRGASPEIARKIATKSGEKPATVYLTSQVDSLKQKVALKRISPDGVLLSTTQIMRTITKGMRDEEIDKKDPAFVAAATELKKIAEAALDMADGQDKSMGPAAGSGNDQGPTYVTGDSTAVATKTQRDAHGRKVPEGEPVERDGYGRVLR